MKHWPNHPWLPGWSGVFYCKKESEALLLGFFFWSQQGRCLKNYVCFKLELSEVEEQLSF